jgi:RimJ/RimL family protein N-acetyltransferase
MDFNENYILQDEKVLLRPLQSDDYDLLVSYALNEPDAWKYSVAELNGAEGMREYIDEALLQRKEQSSYPFIVYDKITNKFIGSTRFYDIQLKHNTNWAIPGIQKNSVGPGSTSIANTCF